MPEISQKDLDALVKKATRKPSPPAHKAAEEPPPEPDRVAVLADGSRFEYSGGHPTHVAVGDREIPVTGVWPLF